MPTLRSVVAICFCLVASADLVAGEVKNYVVYSNEPRFGLANDGKSDETESLQAFIQYVVDNQLTGVIVGVNRITDTLRIRSGSHHPAKRFQLLTTTGVNTSTFPVGSCIHWDGPENGLMVEVNEIKASKLCLSLNNNILKNKGVDGVLFHNKNSSALAANGNEISLYINGCNQGMQIGDHARDGYHSNFDDNFFPAVHMSNTRHPILIDSRAQDNNVIGHLHLGGTEGYKPESREFLIKAKQNGNGFRIENGFIRTDNMITDSIAIDIQAGTFSCNRLSLEGKQRKVMLLRLAGGSTRDISHLCQFTTPPNQRDYPTFRNSKGVCIESHASKGVVFTASVFGGNVLHSTPLSTIGCVFYDDYSAIRQ